MASNQTQEILPRVKEVISGIADIPTDKIGNAHDLREEIGLDSLEMIELLCRIERIFGTEEQPVEFSDQAWREVRTPSDIADFCSKNITYA